MNTGKPVARKPDETSTLWSNWPVTPQASAVDVFVWRELCPYSSAFFFEFHVRVLFTE